MKKRKYQSGGLINYINPPISSTYTVSNPLQLLNLDSIKTSERYNQAVVDLQNIMENQPQRVRDMAKMLYGADPEKWSKRKSKVERYGEKQTGGDLISQLGYRNDSPFKNASQLTINSPNISMENVSTPLIGISNQTGETKLMKPNKKYNFKNTSSVTEMPAYQDGGFLQGLLGAAQGIGSALGPVGMATSTLLPLVSKLFSNPEKTVVSASPGNYASGGGLSRKKDYGSKSKPYPSVDSSDFAGGHRSYPIPTIADAVDALRLAGLHHRPDVKAKVYEKYPSLKHRTGGNININPENKGKFTASAKRADMGVQEFASHVLANKEDYSPTQVKRANFARNASKWNHQTGGNLQFPGRKLNPEYFAEETSYYSPSVWLDAKELPTSSDKFQKIKDLDGGYTLLDYSGSTLLRHPKTGKYAFISKEDANQYQTGGDIPLSSDAFQVQGNPHITDGNSYPHLNANLDHNEVVTNTQQGQKFVFSADLKDPITGKAFSDLASKQERAKGKAEKILKQHPFDEQAKSTISLSNANLDNIANIQESVATALGHRNSDGSTRQDYKCGGKMKYQAGGQIGRSLSPNSPFWWQNGNMDSLRANTAAPGIPYAPPSTFVTVADAANSTSFAPEVTPPTISNPNSVPRAADFIWDPLQQKYISKEGLPSRPNNLFVNRQLEGLIPSTRNNLPSSNENVPTAGTTTSTRVGQPRKQNTPVSANRPENILEFQKLYNQNISSPNPPLVEDNKWGPKTAQAYENYLQTKQLNREIGLPFTTIPSTRNSISEVRSLNPTFGEGNMMTWNFPSDPATTASSDQLNAPAKEIPPASYKTPWTLGDTLKGVELIGKSIGAFGKAEQEPQLLDNTQITQEVYDPTQALYSNQRNYSNYLAGIGAAVPLNLRRGLAGQALASKYSSDAGITSQYQQMNQGARTQYQQRVANQRRFNIQSQARTNELNAANRAAQDAVQQNFFTSLGQFGEDLNRKRYAADMINLYRNQAPDVFDSYIQTLNRNGR